MVLQTVDAQSRHGRSGGWTVASRVATLEGLNAPWEVVARCDCKSQLGPAMPGSGGERPGQATAGVASQRAALLTSRRSAARIHGLPQLANLRLQAGSHIAHWLLLGLRIVLQLGDPLERILTLDPTIPSSRIKNPGPFAAVSPCCECLETPAANGRNHQAFNVVPFDPQVSYFRSALALIRQGGSSDHQQSGGGEASIIGNFLALLVIPRSGFACITSWIRLRLIQPGLVRKGRPRADVDGGDV